MIRVVQIILPALLSSVSTFALASSDVSDVKSEEKSKEINLEKITVEGEVTANTQTVGTFNSPVSNLEYDPRVDLQSRNMAEAQADVTIRGGIFENTGFRVGSATLLDPQTGHYFAEIPIAQEMLTSANIMTGVDNALYGFNSSVGTVSRGWTPITTQGSVSVGVGNNGFNLQRVHSSFSVPLDKTSDWKLGIEGEHSLSESDGSIENGDHDFRRTSARIQLAGPSSQTDLFFGYQEKFFGWPNLYTPFNVNETEDLTTRLLVLNHQQNYGAVTKNDSTFEVSAYYRRHNDHYVFSRENPAIFEAFHETDVKSVAVSGRHAQSSSLALNYSAQFIGDSIESTTLENNFTSRSYYKVSVLPEYQMALTAEQELIFRLGGTYDDTNRDDSDVSLIGDIRWNKTNSDSSLQTVYVSFAQASQVAGYTAIGGSDSGGLFRSNYNLERETTENFELGLALDKHTWRLESAIFYRVDDGLTDWTYNLESTSARAANPVDIDTLGLEFLVTKHLDDAKIITSYTFLDKSEDYGSTEIDASFYALNYPDHRITLGAVWNPSDIIEVRVDNEWRKHDANILRNGDDQAFFTHFTLNISPSQFAGLHITLAADNPWGESFEEVPGTPGRGEQYSATVSYHW